MASSYSDLRERRDGMRLSRAKFAELSGLTQGRVWAIENEKGQPVSEDEARRLDVVLGGGSLAGEPAAVPPTGTRGGGSRKSSTARVGPSSDVPTRPTVLSGAPPLPDYLRPVIEGGQTDNNGLAVTERPIDWTALQAAAASVSEHDVERALAGPDPRAGYRLFSHSEFATASNCKRKWWLTYYRSLRLKAESPVGVRQLGDRVHRALKAWYVPEGSTRIDPRDALELEIVKDWTRITHTNPQGVEGLQGKFNQQTNLERAMIEGYVTWIEETGADSDLRVTGSEQYIEADISGDVDVNAKLIGKLDVRVYRDSDGVRAFVDHKTVASLDPKNLVMNTQMLHYLLLEFLNTEDGEARCDGALYNMLRRVGRTAAAKPPFYGRVEVRHNIHEITSYRRHAVSNARDIIDMEERLNAGESHHDVAPPRPSDTCAWSCDFFPVCNLFDDGSRAEGMLESFYWKHDPLSYYRNQDLVTE